MNIVRLYYLLILQRYENNIHTITGRRPRLCYDSSQTSDCLADIILRRQTTK